LCGCCHKIYAEKRCDLACVWLLLQLCWVSHLCSSNSCTGSHARATAVAELLLLLMCCLLDICQDDIFKRKLHASGNQHFLFNQTEVQDSRRLGQELAGSRRSKLQ
jgi:hypothetical protein